MSDETFPYASFSRSCTLSGSVGVCGGASCLVKVADLHCFTNTTLSTMMMTNTVTVITSSPTSPTTSPMVRDETEDRKRSVPGDMGWICL